MPFPNSNDLGIFSGLSDGSHNANPLQRAVFRVNAASPALHQIPDGTSNTMLVAEYLTGIPGRNVGMTRGTFFSTRAGLQFLYVTQTPNSPNPEILWWDNADGCGADWNNAPQHNMPCVGGPMQTNFASPRSRHSGGVNVLMGDGRVQFVQNGIDTNTWRWMGWIADGNVVGEF